MMKFAFDMDGTIADLYGTNNWLTKLENAEDGLFRDLKPMYDMDELANVLDGVEVIVITWLPRMGDERAEKITHEYTAKVAEEKREWLRKHNFPCTEVHCLPYGTPKASVLDNPSDYILVDDNREVREEFFYMGGHTVDATKNILHEVKSLVQIVKNFSLSK